MSTKYCPGCKADIPVKQFTKAVYNKDGLNSMCKACRRAYMKTYYRANKKKMQDQARDRRYGLEPGEYDRRWEEQDGKCAICRLEPDHTLHVDHDHKTGAVRGLLCHNCNNLLAQAKDDVIILEQAKKYLHRYAHL